LVLLVLLVEVGWVFGADRCFTVVSEYGK